MKISELDQELSLKIGDFKSDLGDGESFDFEDRLKYFERAYSKLRRYLRTLMRDYQPHFISRRTVVTFTHSTINPLPLPIPSEE